MSKLIDILASELKEWPEECEFIVQDHDGECWASKSVNSAECYDGYWCTDYVSSFRATPSDDRNSAIVTYLDWSQTQSSIEKQVAK